MIFRSLLLSVLLALTTRSLAAQDEASRPNVLLILADDLGY
ncbi:MAG: hypothetical protein RL885_20610 [Planctomycetota bacterium]